MMKTVIYKKQTMYEYTHCKHTHMPYPNPINIIRSRGLVTTTQAHFIHHQPDQSPLPTASPNYKYLSQLCIHSVSPSS